MERAILKCWATCVIYVLFCMCTHAHTHTHTCARACTITFVQGR